MLYVARRYDVAIEQLRKTLELEPNNQISPDYLGWVCLQKRMDQEVIAELQRVVNQRTGSLVSLAGLGRAYAVAGKRDGVNRVLDQLKALSGQTYVVPYWAATSYAGLGERQEACVWLQRAFHAHDPLLPWKDRNHSLTQP